MILNSYSNVVLRKVFAISTGTEINPTDLNTTLNSNITGNSEISSEPISLSILPVPDTQRSQESALTSQDEKDKKQDEHQHAHNHSHAVSDSTRSKSLESFQSAPDIKVSPVLSSSKKKDDIANIAEDDEQQHHDDDKSANKNTAAASSSSAAASASSPIAQGKGEQQRHYEMIAGSTMAESPEAANVKKSWSNGIASLYHVRIGPDYDKHGKKAPSADALYDLVACDLIKNTFDKSTMIDHIALSDIQMPQLRDIDELDVLSKCPIPRVLICNVQVPYLPPKIMGSSDPDPGFSLVFYFALRPDIARAAAFGTSGGKAVQAHGPHAIEQESKRVPAIHLWTRFVQQWKDSDREMRRRFKAIGIGANLKDLGLPGAVVQYNGKPVIINKCAQIYGGEIDGNPLNRYIEIDIQVHTFNFVARKGLSMLKGLAPKIRARAGFVVQGEHNSELPETILGCAELHNLDVDDAIPVKIPPLSQRAATPSGAKAKKPLTKTLTYS